MDGQKEGRGKLLSHRCMSFSKVDSLSVLDIKSK